MNFKKNGGAIYVHIKCLLIHNNNIQISVASPEALSTGCVSKGDKTLRDDRTQLYEQILSYNVWLERKQ